MALIALIASSLGACVVGDEAADDMFVEPDGETPIAEPLVSSAGSPFNMNSVLNGKRGPAQESCTKSGIRLNKNDNWKNAIESSSNKNKTILLDTGTYNLSSTLQPAEGVTIKPYNCGNVHIKGNFTAERMINPRAGLTIAGLTIESNKVKDLVKIQGTSSKKAKNITFRHNNMLGGTNKVFRITRWTQDVDIVGNVLNGASSGHVVWVSGSDNSTSDRPKNILIEHNILEKDYFGSSQTTGEDVFSVKSGGSGIVFSNNLIRNVLKIENAIDLKGYSNSGSISILHNYFQCQTIQLGQGNDGGTQTITVGNDDSPNNLSKHIISGNYFNACTGGALAVGGNRKGSADFSNNVIYFSKAETHNYAGIFKNAYDTQWVNNTFYRGGYKFYECNDIALENNIFFETKITTKSCGSSAKVRHNDFYKTSFGGGAKSNNVNVDPKFQSVGGKDFRLKSSSPVKSAGKNGQSMGALGSSGSSGPSCGDAVCDGAETCSTCPSDCGQCTSDCPVGPGDWQYCKLCGPCGEGEGDCDGDKECAPGLECMQDVGADYGWPTKMDVCEDPGGSSAQTCAQKYGSVDGYKLCSESATECAFNANINQSKSCNQICQDKGGSCLAQHHNGATCELGADKGCDSTAANTDVCICTL